MAMSTCASRDGLLYVKLHLGPFIPPGPAVSDSIFRFVGCFPPNPTSRRAIVGILSISVLSPSCSASNIVENSQRQGFDEYMNIVLEDAEEISLKRKSRKSLGAHPSPFLCFSISKININMLSMSFSSYLSQVLVHFPLFSPHVCHSSPGRTMLKGDNITLMYAVKAR